MGYPPSSGFGYPGDPQPNPAGGYPDQPLFTDGYGLVGREREIHDQRQRAIAAGMDPRQFDAQVAQARAGKHPASTADR